jgi:hypothetical protein
MRRLWPLILIAVAFFAYNHWIREPSQGGQTARSTQRASASQPGGPVRDLQRQPAEVMDMQGAMQSGGVSSKALIDTARGAR